MRRGRGVAVSRAALLFALSLCAACASSQYHPLVGHAAPEIISAEALGGDGPTTLKAAQGKVVILDFWATFCEPCKKSFPKYQEIVDQFPGDVVVLAVSTDEPADATKEQILAFAKKHHATFPIIWDKDGSVRAMYGYPARLPSTFLIDRTGTVRYLYSGYGSWEGATIKAKVEGLVHAGAGP
jgi:cytochrome c biogenesis protein CcmG, thiol:disulfide interchange protein DsbE